MKNKKNDKDSPNNSNKKSDNSKEIEKEAIEIDGR